VTAVNDDELKAWANAEARHCRSLGRPSVLQWQLMDENTNARSLTRAKQIRQELLDAELTGSTPHVTIATFIVKGFCVFRLASNLCISCARACV
jgi:hypothetical protein